MNVLPSFIYVHHRCGWWPLYALELELKTVESHHVGAATLTQALAAQLLLTAEPSTAVRCVTTKEEDPPPRARKPFLAP